MRIIKFFFLAMVAWTAATFSSCTDYQDEIDALDYRVTVLENLVGTTNDNIKAMQTLINASADGWVITGIVEVEPYLDPDGVGYRTITFGKIDPETGELSTDPDDKKVITIHNGLKGDNGLDAQAPNLKLKQDPDDGNYYWTLDDEWLTNDEGERIRVNGKDGQDGRNGQDGKDGKDGVSTAPLLDINGDGLWIISVDSGATWTLLLDSEGNPVHATGRNGKDGENGADAFGFITSVNISLDSQGNRFVVFTLYDGTEIKLPLK